MSGGRYAEAGVDLGRAESTKERIARLVLTTRTGFSVGAVGSFGGMVRLPEGLRRPVLVLSTDGVGSKVLVAREARRLDTVGEDLVKSVGSATTTYALTAGGSPLAQQVGSGKSFFLRDPHGDSVGLVSSSAAKLGTSSYDPFGQVLSFSGTQSALGYQSDLTDPVTKQVDMGTRWYAPGQGRFSTRDVIFGDPLHPVSLNQWPR